MLLSPHGIPSHKKSAWRRPKVRWSPFFEPLEERALLASIIDLGTLPGPSESSTATAINDSGQVVGYSGSAGGTHAFLYSGGEMTDLGTLPGDDFSWATGINDSGQVVGFSGGGNSPTHAFLYSDGEMTDLGTLPGDDSSEASAINDTGQVVGYSGTEVSPRHAFLYSDGEMTDLGTLPGDDSSVASAINDTGQVVGYSHMAGVPVHAFLYSDGEMTGLGNLPGDDFSWATGINDSGQVVGSSGGGNSPNHAFLYSDGEMTDLGTLPGDDSSVASAINDTGQVVGYSEFDSGTYNLFGHLAFLYNNVTGMVALNSLLPANSGWVLLQANAINNNGQIVGIGTDNGAIHAFLLDLSAPTYVVNDSSDLPLDPKMAPAETADGTITLRSAIQQVDSDGGGSIGFASAMTITTSGFPAITADGVTIDGGTLGSVVVQGEENGPSGLVLDGGGAVIEDLAVTGFSADGIDVYSADNEIQDNLLSDNTSSGILISGSGASGNLVQGNLIGTSADGSQAMGNGYAAVSIEDGASLNTVGGTSAAARNILSGNGFWGVVIFGSGTTGNLVEGNYIGTDQSGSFTLGDMFGIGVYTPGNTIGGATSGAGNVISGNTDDGIYQDSGGGSTLIQDNFIGTNAAGTAAVANGADGMEVYGGDNTIGGTAVGAGNLISGNALTGVIISGTSAEDNLVQGNLIGVDIGGSAALGNGTTGLGITSGASGNTVGGTTAGSGNVVSGNQSYGVDVENGNQNDVAGNLIGTDSNGTSAVGNGFTGVIVEGADNTIGGTTAAAANVISSNGGGVFLLSATLVIGNKIGTDSTGDAALGNAYNGIEIYYGDASTIGGTTPGAGNIISSNSGPGVSIYGSSNNLIQGNTIGVDAAGNAPLGNSGYGISAWYATGNTIGGTIPVAGNVISGNGDAGIEIGDDQDLIVGNMVGTNARGIQPLGNTGDGIDVSGDQNTIGGTVDGAGNIIAANSGSGVVLDGASGNLVVGNSIGVDATGNIPMGNGSGVEIVDGASNNTIGGTTQTARNLISASTSDDGDGVLISGDDTTGNLLQGNYIGTGNDGISTLGNQADGVAILDASGNTVGGTSSGAGNLISANGGNGVDLDGVTNTLVAGNLIGTNGDGNGALGNAKVGVLVEDGSTGNSIGGTTSGALNVISGNSGDGVDIEGSGTSQNLVAGAYIGLDVTGSRPVSNQGNGVSLSDGASANTIGGMSGSALDLISANNLVGVAISGNGTDENLVAGNFIGTDVAGSFSFGNSSGVNILDGASDNTIGGTIAGVGNVISASTSLSGVLLSGANTAGNLVAGNEIGTDVTGSYYLRNATDGVTILGASENTIGGTSKGARNIISLNSVSGVDLDGATDNLVEGNDIGTNAGGTADLGNSQAGITVQNAAAGNTIGGTSKGAGNTIAFNGGNGLTVGMNVLDAALDNAILENSIFSNNLLGIDVDNTAPQAAPVVTSAIADGSQTTITGTVSGAPNTTFRIEFFSNPAGTSQGKTYLGFVDIMTNAGGSASFSFAPALVVAQGLNITATATDPNGNTSEFSAAVTVQSNVTSDLSVKSGGFVYNRTTRQFSQTLTITNISGAPIIGPIELELLNLKNATLVNQTGMTQGNPYVTVLSSGYLGVGQSLTITLVFADPTLAQISYTAEFLAGPMPDFK